MDNATTEAFIRSLGGQGDVQDTVSKGRGQSSSLSDSSLAQGRVEGQRGTESNGGGVREGSAQSDTRDGRGRDTSRSDTPLAGAPVVEGAAGPDAALVAVAEQYARDNGINLKRQEKYAQVNEAFAK